MFQAGLGDAAPLLAKVGVKAGHNYDASNNPVEKALKESEPL